MLYIYKLCFIMQLKSLSVTFCEQDKSSSRRRKDGPQVPITGLDWLATGPCIDPKHV